jgi:hypothetical protein
MRLGYLCVWVKDRSGAIASTGHNATQRLHSVHVSRLTSNCPNLRLNDPSGQRPTHPPQTAHAG